MAAASFLAAEEVYRDSLRAVTIADMLVAAAAESPPEKVGRISDWVEKNAVHSA